MTNGKLGFGAVLLAGLAAACSSSKGGSTGTAGSSAGGSTGAAGGAGSGGATAGSGGAHAGSTGSSGSGGAGGAVALATPVELVSVMGCGNLRLVLANGTIYYTNQMAGTVSSVAVAGGTPKVIAMDQKTPNPIAADATNVYWGNNGDGNVMKAPVGGGTASVFFSATAADGGAPDAGAMEYPNALLVNGTNLFVGRGLDTFKLPIAGGAPLQLTHSLEIGYPGAFAFDGTHLYQPEISHNAITREVIDGTQMAAITDGSVHALSPDRIAVSRASLVTDAIQISGQNVVWANGTDIEFHDKDKNEMQGTVARINSAAGFNPLSGFVISDNKVYIGETSDNNVEVITPLTFTPSDNAPPPVVIAMHQPNPAEFAADTTNIYYTTITSNDANGTCKIMKLAK
jgi:hypothetical protein